MKLELCPISWIFKFSNFRIFQYFTLFAHFSPEPDFSRICGFRNKLDNNKMLHFRPFLAKTLDSIFLQKSKNLIFGLFGIQIPKFGHLGNFPEKSGSVTFLRLWSSNFMKKP